MIIKWWVIGNIGNKFQERLLTFTQTFLHHVEAILKLSSFSRSVRRIIRDDRPIGNFFWLENPDHRITSRPSDQRRRISYFFSIQRRVGSVSDFLLLPIQLLDISSRTAIKHLSSTTRSGGTQWLSLVRIHNVGWGDTLYSSYTFLRLRLRKVTISLVSRKIVFKIG